MQQKLNKGKIGNFPGGPVAKILGSQCRGPGFDSRQETGSHIPRLRVHMPQLRHSTAKYKYFFFKEGKIDMVIFLVTW